MENKKYVRPDAKIRYEWLKEHGICVQCGQNDAFNNRVRCADCLYKNNERQIQADAKRMKSKAEYNKIRYHKMKEEGRCPRCTKKAYKDYVYCYEHLIKFRKIERERWQRNKKGYAEQGLCRICGEECVSGKKYCPTHYEEKVKQMAHARQFQNLEDNWFYKSKELFFTKKFEDKKGEGNEN